MKKHPGKKIWYVIKIEKFKSSLVDTGFEKPSPFTMPINETPINMSNTGQKIVAFSLLFFSVI